MPVLTNPKWELFAHGLAEGKSADLAYREAGYRSSRGNASRLKSSDIVAARISELLSEKGLTIVQVTAEAIGAVQLSKQWVLETLIENARRAMQISEMRDQNGKRMGDFVYQGSVANRALELLGKELGMFIDRKEVGQPGDFDSMSADELRASILRRAAELGITDAQARYLGGPPKTNGSGRTH